MEVFVPCNTSSCLDISSCSGYSTDPHGHHPTQYNSVDLSMNDLKTCLSEILNVEDIGTSTKACNLSPGGNDKGDVVKEYEFKGSGKNLKGLSASEKCFGKCATFPPFHGHKSSGSVLIDEKGQLGEDATAEVPEINGPTVPLNKCCSRSVSLPVPLKLVSALKGSREKLGVPPKNLSVTWAPDVYDPIPTSVSHVPSNRSHSYRSNKKSGKYKQKGGGKSSRGSKGKDKKQARINGGWPIRAKPIHENSGIGFCEPVHLDAGSPDPYCGSSFLKKSVTKLHYPIAEAS